MTNQAFSNDQVIIRELGMQSYSPVVTAMKSHVDGRQSDTADELWVLEHSPVFTLGQAGKQEHLLDAGSIPVVQTDRGGQITYHGPGQLVIYLLVDIRRRKLGVRALVTLIENSLIQLLKGMGLEAYAKPDAPGVYIDGAKIAALGLRIRKGVSYHGLSLNMDMDLEPFRRINPCGYAGLEVIQLKDLVPGYNQRQVTDELIQHLVAELGYTGGSVLAGLPEGLS